MKYFMILPFLLFSKATYGTTYSETCVQLKRSNPEKLLLFTEVEYRDFCMIRFKKGSSIKSVCFVKLSGFSRTSFAVPCTTVEALIELNRERYHYVK